MLGSFLPELLVVLQQPVYSEAEEPTLSCNQVWILRPGKPRTPGRAIAALLTAGSHPPLRRWLAENYLPSAHTGFMEIDARHESSADHCPETRPRFRYTYSPPHRQFRAKCLK